VLINWWPGLDLFTCAREREVGVGICRQVFCICIYVTREKETLRENVKERKCVFNTL
jgi:hypothetical protein